MGHVLVRPVPQRAEALACDSPRNAVNSQQSTNAYDKVENKLLEVDFREFLLLTFRINSAISFLVSPMS